MFIKEIKKKNQDSETTLVKERTLFSLQEKIILYDLANTYFEGTAKKSPFERETQ